MSSLAKWSIIFGFMLVTYLYAYFQRERFSDIFNYKVDEYILKEIPDLKVSEVFKGGVIDKASILKGSEAVIIHFWGTWCAPCEEEFPDIMEYVNRLRVRPVKFLIVAVRDELPKVKKYLSRYQKYFRNNLIFAFDKKGSLMGDFGTLKVPETYIFDKNGRLYKKLIGPQVWQNQYYQDLVTTLLDNQKRQ